MTYCGLYPEWSRGTWLTRFLHTQSFLIAQSPDDKVEVEVAVPVADTLVGIHSPMVAAAYLAESAVLARQQLGHDNGLHVSEREAPAVQLVAPAAGRTHSLD